MLLSFLSLSKQIRISQYPQTIKNHQNVQCPVVHLSSFHKTAPSWCRIRRTTSPKKIISPSPLRNTTISIISISSCLIYTKDSSMICPLQAISDLFWLSMRTRRFKRRTSLRASSQRAWHRVTHPLTIFNFFILMNMSWKSDSYKTDNRNYIQKHSWTNKNIGYETRISRIQNIKRSRLGCNAFTSKKVV